MAEIVRVEWLTYRRVDTEEWAQLSELCEALPLQPLRIRTIEFPEVLPRLLVGVVHLRGGRRERARVEVDITYLLMSEHTMQGVARSLQRYHAFRSCVLDGRQSVEIPIALDADENYFSRAYPDLVPKSIMLKARLLEPRRSAWCTARIDYLYTPWGD